MVWFLDFVGEGLTRTEVWLNVWLEEIIRGFFGKRWVWT